MVRNTWNPEDRREIPLPTACYTRTIANETDVGFEFIEQRKEELINNIDTFIQRGSGWVIKQVNYLEISFEKCNSFRQGT